MAFLGLLVLGGAWALASPLTAPPDEPTQVSRADALVHGQLIGTKAGPAQPEAVTVVRVPEDLAVLQREERCLDLPPTVPVACLNRIVGTTRPIPALIYAGRYPPLYYAVVGLPSLFEQGPGVVYWMRLVSVALSAAFLALAATWVAARGRSPWALVGVAVAVTPMVLYLAASVNPNGLEIAVAIALWASSLVLVTSTDDPPRSLVSSVGACAMVLTVVRGDSFLWPFLVAVCLAPMASRRLVSTLWHRRDVRAWLAGVAVAYVAAAAWVLLEHSLAGLPGTPLPPGASGFELWVVVARQTPGWIRQYVGDFGALVLRAPAATYLVTYAAVMALLAAGAWRAQRRALLSLALTVGAALTAPIALQMADIRQIGLGAQGRYFLPLAVGVPLVAAAIVPSRPVAAAAIGPARSDRLTVGVAASLVVLVAAAQVVAFYATLRRYTVGVDGPLLLSARRAGSWHPPLAPQYLVVAFALAAACMGAAVILAIRRQGERAAVRPAFPLVP